MQKSVKIYSRIRPQCVVKVVSGFERKLKRMGETVAVVNSKVFSWAWSSSPEVDEVVEDAGRRQRREEHRGMCHSLSVKPGGTKGSRWSLSVYIHSFCWLWLMLWFLLDAVVDAHAMSEGWRR